jgi:large subunit ribosomal protein L15
MKIGELGAIPGARKARKRVGRGPGSGRGKRAGRGQKGQFSRSGSTRRPGFEGGQTPLFMRVPKRGFTNVFRIEYEVVNVGEIEARGLEGEITPEVLQKARLVRRKQRPVKLLGVGELSLKLTVRGVATSASAREKIEAAGGTVEAAPANETT